MLRTLRLLAYVCLPLVTLLLSSLWTPTAYGGSPTVIYVDKDATGGTGDGTSWANAYTTLQGALDWTNAHGTAPFEIWVAEGVYYPDLGGSHTADSQSEYFKISYDNVQLFGGFAATETLRTQRMPSVRLTILSGDIDADNSGADTNTDGNFVAETSADIQGSNAYHVLYLDGETNEAITAATVLDGVIVTAGSATGSGASDWNANGGGLYCGGDGAGKGCSPTVANVIFSGNNANSAGGGMFNNGGGGTSSPTLTNVTFQGNRSEFDNGGGMFNNGGGGTSSPVLTNVTFTSNRADKMGGGMANNATAGGVSSPTLINVTFTGNLGDFAGGGMFNNGDNGTSSPVITNATFSGNGVRDFGGGGMFNVAANGGTSSPQLVNVIMWGDGALIGAEIFNQDATPAISYSDVNQNGIIGTSNIRQDPKFVAPTTGNYHLQPGSPAIDAGTNTGCPPADLDGLTRPLDGNGDGSAICDMGAYETQLLFVDVDATGGTRDGSTWANAYTTLQDALDWTNAHGRSIFEIWVAEGVYYPDLGGGHGADGQSASFRINYNNVQLYGGFAATETLRTQRIAAVHPTILSGDIDGNDTNTDGNFVAETSNNIQGSNAYHVFYLDGETNEALTAATVLDGFIVTAGSAMGNSWDGYGGGLYCAGSGSGKGCSPTVANAIFAGNQVAYRGGGMFNNAAGGTSSPTLTNVTFTGNNAFRDGGGIYNDGSSAGTSSPTLTNVAFIGNTSYSYGGGMYNNGYGGTSSPVMVNVTFSDNSASSGGGGMYNSGFDGACNPQMVNVIMWGNRAFPSPQISNDSATPDISYSDIDQFGITGTGNIRQDPKFVETANGNYRLALGSPAIDTGTNTGCPAADLDGIARPIDGIGDGTPICDMGAYEAPRVGRYVDVDAGGATHDGKSWATAYTTLQEALDWSNAHNSTDFEIWVAEGVYYPNLGGTHSTEGQSASFRIGYDNVQLYGGFAATETYRSERIPTVHPTILSGDIDGDDTNIDGNFVAETYSDIQGSNAYHVLYLDGQTNEPLTADTVLDGFIVTAGTAVSIDANSYGGGLYCAAIGVGTGCSPTIAHVAFSGNQAGFAGGGMCNTGFYGGVSSPVLTNVTFSGNQAGSTGGGMYNHSDSGGVSSPVLADVTFSGNQANSGGGMTNYSYGGVSSPALTNVTFSGNHANYAGGGMLNAVQSNGTSSPQLVNVVMWGDSASDGAEIANNGATPAISYSDIDQADITGTGNIREDPKFVAPVSASSAPTSSGNYRPQPGSPTIDAGTNTGCPATDLDGITRPLDGGGDGTAICDMGAYEAQLLFVDKDATGGTQDGRSWANAYTTLQDALDKANVNSAGVFEIWVAEGVYYPDLGGTHVDNDPGEFFSIKYNHVQLFGGFAATETYRSERNPAVHPTILSGDIDADSGGDDTNTDGNNIAETYADIKGGNAFHVLYLDGQTNTPLTNATVVDGFIVTGGSATGGGRSVMGGGLYCAGYENGKVCSPKLSNVTFSGNKARAGGGGMFNDGSVGGESSPTLTNVTFTGNDGFTAGGGGLYNYAMNGTSSPTLTNVTFNGNTGRFGGGMYSTGMGGVSSPVLTNVTFSGNQADTGGGMCNNGYAGNSSPVLTNVTFSGNKANLVGGGMANNGATGASSPQLVNVIMWGDSAPSDAEISAQDATPTISYSDIDQAGITGTGNIRQDPEFVAPIDASSAPTSTGNYRLQLGSSAIDTGTNTGCPTMDLDGLTRPWDGNADGSAICDMGSYETQLLFVDKDATGGTHDGSSWANAYMTLQDALDRTNTHGTAPFEIWVAEGVYYPDLGGSHVADSRSESFRISYDNVQIYGSFAATETLRTQRNPAAHATILSGDIDADNGGVDTNTDGNFVAETSADTQGSNAYHVLYLDGQTNEAITAATVIDGFIITGGSASGSNADTNGGGLFCTAFGAGKGCSPTISHVTFSGNVASSYGGGMYNNGVGTSISSPLLANVTFRGNKAARGGGLYTTGDNGTGSPVLANVTFSGNSATDAGGGMANIGFYGGTSSPSLTNVTFYSNTAGTGGGIYNYAIGNSTSNPHLVNVILWGDSAATSAEIYNSGGTLDITYSDIDQDGIAGTGNFRQDPLLSSLEDYGGGLLTFALLPGSAAIDTGDSVACAAAPVNNLDQRGVSRPQGGGCDIGAFESRGFILMTAGGSPQETTISSPFSLPLAVFAGSADAEPLGPGGVITLTPPAEGPGLTVTAPFTVTTDAAGLTAGTVVTANGVVGSFNVTATTAGTAFPTVFSLANTPPLPPIARADVAAVLQDTPLLIDVLANDLPGTSPQLAVDAVTQPLVGGIAAIEQNQVRFTPTAGFTGLVTFTSTIHDGNVLTDTAPVTVRITALNSTDGEPQVLSLPAPTSKGGGTVTVPAGTTEIEVPAGAITPAEDPWATYDLVYQELNAPEPSPPGTLFTFGGRAFVLQLFINAELQPDYVFNVPIYVTISYDPNVVTDTSKLALYYYDEGSQQWADDGITILSVDTQAHTFRASIAHLTEFAAGIKAPTGLDPNLEPQILPQLFLPQVQS